MPRVIVGRGKQPQNSSFSGVCLRRCFLFHKWLRVQWWTPPWGSAPVCATIAATATLPVALASAAPSECFLPCVARYSCSVPDVFFNRAHPNPLLP